MKAQINITGASEDDRIILAALSARAFNRAGYAVEIEVDSGQKSSLEMKLAFMELSLSPPRRFDVKN